MTDVPSSLRIAPPGQYRVVGYDQYDYSEYVVGDYSTEEAARTAAAERHAQPNATPVSFSDIYFVVDERGGQLHRFAHEVTQKDSTPSKAPSEPQPTPDRPLVPLSWPLSLVLLCAACIPAAWISALGASWGQSHDDAAAMTFALIILLGVDPFFMRRNHYFTFGGIVIVAGVGIGLASLSWLFRFNTIVFVWIGMTWALQAVAHPTPRGKMIAHQIGLEKANRKSWLNTQTERSERMLMVYDFLTVLFIGVVLLALWSFVKDFLQ
ncbi:hypothetical protein MASR1M60_30270 [Rhodocyclaceae bacterium]